MPTRIRLSRKGGSKLPPNTLNVARPGRFGNPFNWQDIAVSNPKAMVCRQFENWLRGTTYNLYEQDRRQYILDHLYLVNEADFIACWCKADEPCHADVLIRLAKERVGVL